MSVDVIWTCFCGFEVWKAELSEQEFWEAMCDHQVMEHPEQLGQVQLPSGRAR